jgi:hypothetical protein
MDDGVTLQRVELWISGLLCTEGPREPSVLFIFLSKPPEMVAIQLFCFHREIGF